MTFRNGLYRARGHIIFLLGLLASFAIIISLEGIETGQSASTAPPLDAVEMQTLLDAAEEAPVPVARPLRPDQLAWGRLAWRYFEQNIHPETGLPGSVDGFFGVTAWEIGSFLNAMVAAERLGLITPAMFDERLARALRSIAGLPLYDGSLPNKSYDIRTLRMTDYNGKPSETGIGWSALDMARLLVALEVVRLRHPDQGAAVAAIERGWRLDHLVANGSMFGRTAESQTFVQEGRLGYEEYAAKGLVRLGLDAYRALEVADTLRFADVMGIPIPMDGRDHEHFGGDVCTTSEPYILDGLEFGLDTRSRAFAWAVLRVQEARARATGIPTALSEGHVPGAPFFVYNCVIGNGKPWAVLSPTGERFDRLRFLDVKSVFAWSALFPNTYTESLLNEVFPLNNPARGWFTGRFEADQTANGAITTNTNAVILESLHYRAFGPLLPTRTSVEP